MLKILAMLRDIFCKNYCSNCKVIEENEILKKAIEDLQNKLKEEEEYYEKEINTLKNLLSQKLITTEQLNQIKNHLNSKILVQPYSLGFSISADYQYYALSLEDWKEVLTILHDILINELKAYYTAEVFDCDDFALLMNALVVYASYKLLNKQLAFAIAWSKIHAFNIFITNNYRVYIYEPQTNQIFPYPYLTNDKRYDIEEVWFLG